VTEKQTSAPEKSSPYNPDTKKKKTRDKIGKSQAVMSHFTFMYYPYHYHAGGIWSIWAAGK
jgi:hypothetical protein